MAKKIIFSLLACVLAAGAKVHASPFLSLGNHADVSLLLGGSVAYTDNLTLDEFDTLDDFRFIVTPGVTLSVGRGLTNLNGALTVANNLTRYADNTQFNANLWQITGSAVYTTERWNAGINGGFVQREQNESDVNAVRTLIKQTELYGGVDGRYHISPKTFVGSGFEASRREFDRGNNRDRNMYTVPVNFFYELTPKLDATVGFRYRQTDVDSGQDTEDFFYNVGLVGSLTEKLTTSFRIGYQDRRFTGDRGDTGTLAFNSSTNYDFSPRSTFRLGLNRDFVTSGQGNSVERTSARLTWFYLVTARINANLTGSYAFNDYVNSPREDNTYMGRVGLDYMVNSNFSLNTHYIYRDNDSNQRFNSYTENLVSVGANFRY